MKRVIRLTESDLVRIVKMVINEQENDTSKDMESRTIKDLPAVDVITKSKYKFFKLDPKKNNDKLDMVKYEIKTGNILNTKNEKIASTQPNLTDEQFIAWAKRNKLM